MTWNLRDTFPATPVAAPAVPAVPGDESPAATPPLNLLDPFLGHEPADWSLTAAEEAGQAALGLLPARTLDRWRQAMLRGLPGEL